MKQENIKILSNLYISLCLAFLSASLAVIAYIFINFDKLSTYKLIAAGAGAIIAFAFASICYLHIYRLLKSLKGE